MFPIKIVKNGKYKIARKSWMSMSLLKSIKYRDRLHAKLRKMKIVDTRYRFFQQELKNYSKLLHKCIIKAKNNHYNSVFQLSEK